MSYMNRLNLSDAPIDLNIAANILQSAYVRDEQHRPTSLEGQVALLNEQVERLHKVIHNLMLDLAKAR